MSLPSRNQTGDCIDGKWLSKICSSHQDRDFEDAETNNFVKEAVVENSVGKYAEYYPMNHKHRGLCLVFAHEHFQLHLELASRNACSKDQEYIFYCFRRLGFDVSIYKDYTYQKILEKIQKTANMDHTSYDALVVFFSTHGIQGGIYSNDKCYDPYGMIHAFIPSQCPTLTGKPKLFFIQACRGTASDPGYEMRSMETDGDQLIGTYKIPNYADLLVAYSTYDGYYSWTNSLTGSWFIQILTEELNKNAFEKDLLRILTDVNRRMCIDYESYNTKKLELNDKKQTACVVSTLIRLVQFIRNPEI